MCAPFSIIYSFIHSLIIKFIENLPCVLLGKIVRLGKGIEDIGKCIAVQHLWCIGRRVKKEGWLVRKSRMFSELTVQRNVRTQTEHLQSRGFVCMGVLVWLVGFWFFGFCNICTNFISRTSIIQS